MLVPGRNTTAASIEGRRFAPGPARRQFQVHAAEGRGPRANRAREIPGRGLAPDRIARTGLRVVVEAADRNAGHGSRAPFAVERHSRIDCDAIKPAAGTQPAEMRSEAFGGGQRCRGPAPECDRNDNILEPLPLRGSGIHVYLERQPQDIRVWWLLRPSLCSPYLCPFTDVLWTTFLTACTSHGHLLPRDIFV